MTSFKDIFALTQQLAKIHRQLGIPSSYAVDRRLAPHFEAAEDEMVEVGINDEGRPIRLVRPAAEAWARMRRAASRNDIELFAVSGFRSIARQAEIIQGKLDAGEPLKDILKYVAAPGFSEHHTGRALDIGCPEHGELDEAFAETSAFRWLETTAASYGFVMTYPRNNPHRIGYEPWHWCWADHSGGGAKR